jgi:Uma2 family endonuclease
MQMTVAKRFTKAEPALHLGPLSAGILMTKAEFHDATWEEGWRYELINGVLIVSPIPMREERGRNDYLGYLFLTYQNSPEGTAVDGTVFEEEIDTGKNIRRADRVLWAGLGRVPTMEDVPTVIAEFVSKGKKNFLRDYVLKRDEYMAMGVKEY